MTTFLKKFVGSKLLTTSIGKRILSSRPLNDQGLRVAQWIRSVDPTPLSATKFETISVTHEDPNHHVVHIKLNRPKKYNALSAHMIEELEAVYNALRTDRDARVVILSGNGKHFCTGMDLGFFAQMNILNEKEPCLSRRGENVRQIVKRLQNVTSAPVECPVPVIAAMHGYCIGGAIDIATACDLRLCTKDATFSVKEMDLAIVADMGTLQRLPNIVGDQRARELAYTARNFSGDEAKEYGLVLEALEDKKALDDRAIALAKEIASKSPVTVRGAKRALEYKVDHSVQDSLNQVADWNAAHIFSQDLEIATVAMMSKTKPDYTRT